MIMNLFALTFLFHSVMALAASVAAAVAAGVQPAAAVQPAASSAGGAQLPPLPPPSSSLEPGAGTQQLRAFKSLILLSGV